MNHLLPIYKRWDIVDIDIHRNWPSPPFKDWHRVTFRTGSDRTFTTWLRNKSEAGIEQSLKGIAASTMLDWHFPHEANGV